VSVYGIDHVQLAMTSGGEAEMRRFYGGILGLTELPKPANLVARGGGWFQCGALQLHLGVEAEFRPAKKAHPALLVRDLAAMSARLLSAGFELKYDPEPIHGFERVFTADPFGNRIELLQVNVA
jgi:catechol 2,3-dioxygenase-like lactoylglutathione lyase family enzyme